MADNTNPIIVRKIVDEGGHGHHGGAWKVAYADFVTAMMAFFLMLWLLSTADQQKLKGLAQYFSDATENRGPPGGMGGILHGISIVAEDMALDLPASPFAPHVTSLMATPRESDPDTFTLDLAAALVEEGAVDNAARLDDDMLDAERQRREQEAFDEAKSRILNALGETPELIAFTDNLLIDDTPEGLRIQIVDREQSAMFPTASAELYPTAQRLVALVVGSIGGLPNLISIRGHTDSRPFAPAARYDNWRLSADRANATREALVAAGLSPSRIADIRGKADAEPLFPDAPADARNRRMSLVLLRETRADLDGIGQTSAVNDGPVAD